MTQKRDIKLYGYTTSPFVMKVAVYLKYKKIPYEFVHVRPRTNETIKFTGQTQVPVLEIDGEWRKNSTDLGLWLEELYPEPAILPADPAARDKIMKIDDWISDQLIPARFREAVIWTNTLNSLRSGWRLAQIVHGGTPIPLSWRLMWPFGVSKAPFILDMVKHFDPNESMQAMRERITDELEAHLGEGPYLGGEQQPTLADLSAYPILISGYLMGLHGVATWPKRPNLVAWMKRVQSHLPANPLPCDDKFIARPMPF